MSLSFTSESSTALTTEIPVNSRLSAVSWVRQLGAPFGGGAVSQAQDVAVDRQGNAYVVGSSVGGVDRENFLSIPSAEVSFEGKGFLAKYDRRGALQWFKSFDEAPGTDVVSRVAIDSTNNVYIAGNAFFPARGDSRVDYLIKFNTQGEEQWKITPTSEIGGKPVVNDIAVNSKGLYAAGALGSSAWIANYDDAGKPIWARSYDNTTGSTAIDKIAIDPKGDFYATATSSFLGSVDRETLLQRFDSSGTPIWSNSIQKGAANTSIAIDQQSGIYVSLSNVDTQSVNKYDSTGAVIWNVAQGGIDLQVGKNGNVYLAGTAPNSDGTVANYKILEGSDGRLLNTLTLTGSSEPGAIVQPTAIALDKYDRAYLVGSTTGALGDETQVGQSDPFISRFRSSGI